MWLIGISVLVMHCFGLISQTRSETTNGYSYVSNPLTMTTAASIQDGRITRNVSSTPFFNTSDVQLTSQMIDPQADNCTDLSANCYNCNTTNDCVYGSEAMFPCTVKSDCQCFGQRNVTKIFRCTYCFLLEENVDYTCTKNYTNCYVKAAPPQRFNATCTVNSDVFCLGKRNFIKASPCNWTAGYKWYTALVLSITLGGFGADRFYLGYWKEALGKLFSFGGLGVWTLIDIVLIGTSYLMPADGSLYIS